MTKHATVQRDGYTVPLIGVPKKAVQDECDGCGKEFDIKLIKIYTVADKNRPDAFRFYCPECAKERGLK